MFYGYTSVESGINQALILQLGSPIEQYTDVGGIPFTYPWEFFQLDRD